MKHFRRPLLVLHHCAHIMPPKPKVALSTSKDLVPVGARHIQSAKRGKRDEETGQKPTTTRALILRNRGVVAVKHVTRLTGREKLDLLAGSWAFAVALAVVY